MFVSVIVPIYNAAKLLPRCIESVLLQSLSDWELILVDDGSRDQSSRICKEYSQHDSRIRFISTENRGVSHARNTGIDLAQGEYLYFLDADDRLAENALQLLQDTLGSNRADIVLTDFYKEYRSKSQRVRVLQEDGTFDPYHTRLLGTVWGKLYRRAFIGQQRFDDRLHLCEDAEFNYRLFPKAQTILPCPHCTYHYYYFGSSTIRGYRPERIGQYEAALDRIQACVQQMPAQVQHSANAFTCNVFCVIVMNDLFGSGNTSPLREKFRTLSSLVSRPPFRDALRRLEPGSISRQQALLIRLCLARFYPGVWSIALLNKIRNKLLNY